MSGLLDNVLGTLMQDQATEKMASKFGVEKSQAQSALATALPIIMQAMKRNASTPEGERALENALQKDHSPSILENITDYLEQPNTSEGSKILDHVLGGKRSTVEQFVSKDSGISSGIVDKLLSAAAPVIMGALAGKKQNSNTNVGNILDSITGEMHTRTSSKEQTIIEKLLDQDNDGSIMDDVADIGKSLLGNMFKK
ncbi:uncharacterized protein DUF937 [Balneicella halophila]|uniref:Uncharacterized protein DUF937 n=1 Tax=Balneicella halophila TaxID=1537566 RepID=A0A7L4UR27_BALHA|nr:DUF937 domain-containing protein [Balneicella halophila]PVX52203.1 uncharacterized protein DUF937 [Balneicella halophila]